MGLDEYDVLRTNNFATSNIPDGALYRPKASSITFGRNFADLLRSQDFTKCEVLIKHDQLYLGFRQANTKGTCYCLNIIKSSSSNAIWIQSTIFKKVIGDKTKYLELEYIEEDQGCDIYRVIILA